MYSLRAFPIGGFCLMLGEDEDNNEPGAFNNSPIMTRISSIISGPVFNIILTILIYSLVIAPVAAPIIGQVTKGMPADMTGIKAGEKIVKINDVEINHWKA
jgi:regulator of sigma E protease